MIIHANIFDIIGYGFVALVVLFLLGLIFLVWLSEKWANLKEKFKRKKLLNFVDPSTSTLRKR